MGRVLWLDTGAPTPKSAPPYEQQDLAASRAALLSLEGQSLAPGALESLRVTELRISGSVLRRRDVVDLFDTTPDLGGLNVDVAPFIREDDDRSISVCFRDIPDASVRELSGDAQPRPRADELVQIPLSALAADRPAWTLDHVDGTWVRRRPHPGATAILAVADGGYDAVRGWTGKAADFPAPLVPATTAPEALGSDLGSHGTAWISLVDHLHDTATEARSLVTALGLQEASAVVAAAALHDVGKAHPVFQRTLHETAPSDAQEARGSILWAKTAVKGGRHSRRFFRHELASALALTNGAAPAVDDLELVRYLVGAHHGRVRVSIRPAPDEVRPPGVAPDARYALGIADGDELPSVDTPVGTVGRLILSLDCMELGADPTSWTRDACGLRDRLGPLRLAYLEALVRVADWRSSAS